MEMSSSSPTPEETELTLADRMRGAIWGQFIGDAACLGSHWIYNLSELQRCYPQGVHGFEEPLEGHYHFGKKNGGLTHYGEGALLLLQSVAELGRFDSVDYGKRFVACFGASSYQGYLDKATRGMLENKTNFEEDYPDQPFPFQNGADDDQLATTARMTPVVVAHFEKEDLLDRVELVTRVCQNNDRAVAYAQGHALIIRELFQGRDVHSAVHRAEEMIARLEPHGREVCRKIRAALSASLKSVTDATLKLGQSCPLGSSFPSSVHVLVKHPEAFGEAILAVLRAGGDNAGRAAMVGAWLGAHLGRRAIPQDWINRLAARSKIDQGVEAIMAQVSSTQTEAA